MMLPSIPITATGPTGASAAQQAISANQVLSSAGAQAIPRAAQEAAGGMDVGRSVMSDMASRMHAGNQAGLYGAGERLQHANQLPTLAQRAQALNMQYRAGIMEATGGGSNVKALHQLMAKRGM